MNRRLAVAVIGAVTCMVLVPGVSAAAAVPDADGTVHACYGKVGGVLRVIEPTRGERCLSKAESELTFNQAGQRGPAGPAGTPGADGPAGVSPTVAQLAPGDTHCPAGGAAITDAAGSTAYVCSGATGADGRPGADGQDGAPFSGTFTSPNGAYSISVTDQGVAVSYGSSGLTLTGDTLKITGGTLTIQVSGNTAVEVGAAATLRTGSDLNVQSGGSTTLKPSANLTVDAGGATELRTGTDLDVRSGGSTKLNPGANLTVEAGGATSLKSGGGLGVTAPVITLNSPTCRPAARIADSVAVSGPTGAITGGSSTVCIG